MNIFVVNFALHRCNAIFLVLFCLVLFILIHIENVQAEGLEGALLSLRCTGKMK